MQLLKNLIKHISKKIFYNLFLSFISFIYFYHSVLYSTTNVINNYLRKYGKHWIPK